MTPSVPRGIKHGPVRLRLWSRVEKTGSCWLWRGSFSELGYGFMRDHDGRNTPVHRLAYELEVGPIPEGLEIDHLCRVRNCVNPDHLEPVTHAENIRRGTSPMAAQARQTVCLNGHPLAGENLYVRPDGRRQCRACARERVAAWRTRQEAA